MCEDYSCVMYKCSHSSCSSGTLSQDTHVKNETRFDVVEYFFSCVGALLALLHQSRPMVVVLAPHSLTNWYGLGRGMVVVVSINS